LKHMRANLCSVVCLLLGAVGGRADVIRVQMEPNAPFSGRAPISFTGVESAAAAADPVFGSDGSNTWNYLTIGPCCATFATNPSFSNLVDSAGNTTGVGVAFTGTFTSANDTPVDTNNSNALDNEYFLITNQTVDYSITGLPASTQVALYLYSPNFTHFDSVYPPGEPSRGYTLTANGTTINVPSGFGTNNALTFVTTDSSGDISGVWTTGGLNEGDWSGFQIAYNPSMVPEPSYLLVIGPALAALALIRRKRAA